MDSSKSRQLYAGGSVYPHLFLIEKSALIVKDTNTTSVRES